LLEQIIEVFFKEYAKGYRSMKTLLSMQVTLGVFNNSRENKQGRLEKIPGKNNAGGYTDQVTHYSCKSVPHTFANQVIKKPD